MCKIRNFFRSPFFPLLVRYVCRFALLELRFEFLMTILARVIESKSYDNLHKIPSRRFPLTSSSEIRSIICWRPFSAFPHRNLMIPNGFCCLRSWRERKLRKRIARGDSSTANYWIYLWAALKRFDTSSVIFMSHALTRRNNYSCVEWWNFITQ